MIEDKAFASELRARLCMAITDYGHKIDPAVHSNRPLSQRLLGVMAYALMRMAIWLAGKRY